MSDGFDLDEQMKNQDFEEEFLLSEKMAELMLEDECEKDDLNDEIEEIADEKTRENELSEEIGEVKTKKQLQMTDFFVVKKNKLKLKVKLLFKNCSCPL